MRNAWLVLFVACGGGGPTRPASPTLEAGAFTLSVDGIEVGYSIRGRGPVCIAHPGGPGLSSSYLRSPALEKELTVVYIDPIGTGPSGKLPAAEEYSRERDEKVVDAVRAKLGIDKVCLIGHSYGGMVVAEYASKHPEHVGALLLYSTAAATDEAFNKQIEANVTWFKNEPWFPDAMKAFAEEDKAADQAALSAIVLREAPFYFADWSGHKAAYEPVAANFKTISFEVNKRRASGKAHDYDVRRRLGGLHLTPTVVITGDKDPICGLEPSKALAAEVAGSQLIVIKNAGHMAHIEQPDAFADAVKTFAAKLR